MTKLTHPEKGVAILTQKILSSPTLRTDPRVGSQQEDFQSYAAAAGCCPRRRRHRLLLP